MEPSSANSVPHGAWFTSRLFSRQKLRLHITNYDPQNLRVALEIVSDSFVDSAGHFHPIFVFLRGRRIAYLLLLFLHGTLLDLVNNVWRPWA